MANRITQKAEPKEYDLIIIGGGPGGLGATVYAARYKLNTAIISPEWGGEVNRAHMVENYLGFPGISGVDLAKKFVEHVKKFDVKMIEDEVNAAKVDRNVFKVFTRSGKTLSSKTLILTVGTQRRKLNVPGEEKFLGKGVSYCATCDGWFYKDKIVAIVGGSDAAGTSALLLSDIAKKVYIIYRKAELRAEPLTIERIKKRKNIEIIYNANVVELSGNEFLQKAKLDIGKEIELDGIFIEIGGVPSLAIVSALNLKTDENGYVITDDEQKTSLAGVFAAGDIVAKNKLKQIITAAAEGAVAAFSAYKYIKTIKS